MKDYDPDDWIAALVGELRTTDPRAVVEQKIRAWFGTLPEAAFRSTTEKVLERRCQPNPLVNEVGYAVSELKRIVEDGRYAAQPVKVKGLST